MPKAVDQRDYSFSRAFDQSAAIAKSSKKLPKNHKIKLNRVNGFIGGAEQVMSFYEGAEAADSGLEANPAPIPDKKLADYQVIALALRHLEKTRAALGFRRTDKPEFLPDPYIKRTSAGTRIVNFLQHHRGIPVFQMERSVEIDRRGAIKSVDGMSASLPRDLDILPSVMLESAMLAAARYVASPSGRADQFTKEPIPDPVIDLTDYQPRVIARIPLTSQPSVLDKGPFGEVIPAHLVFFYQGRKTRLGWYLLISTPGLEEQYVVIVEADSRTKDKSRPEIIYGQRALSYMAETRGNVWAHNPDVNPTRQAVKFPRPLEAYPLELPLTLPEGFPFSWVRDGLDVTRGNNAIAVFINGDAPFQGQRVDNGDLVFDPNEEKGNDQKVLNAFYFCNFMHDFFFLLGFDESRNFQDENTTSLGAGGDAVKVVVLDTKIPDLANMTTLADGFQAMMKLGLVVSDKPEFHTALDSDVVFHEYTHGVTRRTVGRSLDTTALQAIISQGLDEGWSDYFALTIQNYNLETERTKVLDYALNEGKGLRSLPYDDDYSKNALKRAGLAEDAEGGVYALIGLPIYTEAHTIGEIWCATLMKLNRDLGKAFDDKKKGHRLGWQIVFDGQKKLTGTPDFISARDKILSALDDLLSARLMKQADHQKAKQAALGAFVHFGLGAKATPSSLGSLRVVGDTRQPPDL